MASGLALDFLVDSTPRDCTTLLDRAPCGMKGRHQALVLQASYA